jgi:hypothetical protein
MQMTLSYPICSSLRRSFLLPLNPLSDLPQSLNRKQGRVNGRDIGVWWSIVVRQARGNGSMVTIGQANDEVGVWPSAYPNELDSLAVQRVVRMCNGHPFRRWFAKRGSVR